MADVGRTIVAEMPATESMSTERRPSHGFGGWYVTAGLQDGKTTFGVCMQEERTTVCLMPDNRGGLAALGIMTNSLGVWPAQVSAVKIHCRKDSNWPDTDDDASFAVVASPVFDKQGTLSGEGQSAAKAVFLLRDLAELRLEDALPDGRMRISLLVDSPGGSNYGSRYIFVDMSGFQVAWDAMLVRRHAAYSILMQEGGEQWRG